jgi:integrase
MGLYQRGNTWFIDYRAHSRRVRERVGPDRHLAELALKKRQVAIAENRFLDIKRQEKIRFEDFAEEYIENHSKPNNRSWEQAEAHNIKRLKIYFSGKLLDEITPLDIEKFKAQAIKEVSQATVNRALALLSSMFNRATSWKRFSGINPVKGIRFYKEQGRLRYLEKEEIAKLIDNCNGHLKSIVTVALFTGMRKSEILNLKWRDVDFNHDIIYLYQTKNGEKREVPMNALVKSALIKVEKNPDSQYIFANRRGGPYTNIRKSFFTALTKCDIINFRFHDLRHTFASQLAMAGVDINTIRELMGHKSLKMTLRYSHLSPDHKKRAVDVLSRQMVTNWSQEPISEISEKVEKPQLFENTVVTAAQ